jgi:hypothetical protein
MSQVPGSTANRFGNAANLMGTTARTLGDLNLPSPTPESKKPAAVPPEIKLDGSASFKAESLTSATGNKTSVYSFTGEGGATFKAGDANVRIYGKGVFTEDSNGAKKVEITGGGSVSVKFGDVAVTAYGEAEINLNTELVRTKTGGSLNVGGVTVTGAGTYNTKTGLWTSANGMATFKVNDRVSGLLGFNFENKTLEFQGGVRLALGDPKVQKLVPTLTVLATLNDQSRVGSQGAASVPLSPQTSLNLRFDTDTGNGSKGEMGVTFKL